MSDAPKPNRRGERFTMLEEMGPNNPIPGSEAWPVVDLAPPDPFALGRQPDPPGGVYGRTPSNPGKRGTPRPPRPPGGMEMRPKKPPTG